MVVSIEISGPYEERLRRLVELGVYASVAEAVRDAIRRLMNEIDMRRIGLTLYTRRGSSLLYYCELAGEPCNTIIEYMLVNEVAPRLGVEGDGDSVAPPPGTGILVDGSAILVAYLTLAWRVLEAVGGVYRYYIVEDLAPMERVYYALARRHGHTPRISFSTLRAPRTGGIGQALVSSVEASSIRAAKKHGLVLLSDDGYVREVARSEGVDVTTTAALMLEAYRRGLLTRGDVEEIAFSLRALPYIYPAGVLEAGGG